MSEKKLPLYKQRECWRSHAPRLPPAEPAPPPCTNCGGHLTLRRIEPATAGYDLRIYECPRCENTDQYLVRYQTADPWVLVCN